MLNVVVTGGGTIARIDDVRHIANVSSGRFSSAITEACLRRGANVWHVHARSAILPFLDAARFDLDAPDPTAEHERLETLRREWSRVRDRLRFVSLHDGGVAEYEHALHETFKGRRIDVAFLAMAVSDYEPVPVAGKIASDAEQITIRAHRTPKVIRSIRDWAPEVFLVGFKLLSGAGVSELVREAEDSGRANRADLTVANDLQLLRQGRHTVHLVRAGHPVETLGPGDNLAETLVARVFSLVHARSGGE